MGNNVKVRTPHINDTTYPKRITGYRFTRQKSWQLWTADPRKRGVFQGSPISAIFVIIYLDDVMEGYDALNYLINLPLRHAEERTRNEISAQLRLTVQENT